MDISSFWDIIINSEMDGWEEIIVEDNIYQSYCLQDINIRIVDNLNAGVITNFSAPWITSGFQHVPIKHDIALFYGSTCIKIVPVVRINNANAFIPFPIPGTDIISVYDYHIAKKGVHENNDLDDYILRCNLSLQR